MNKKQRENTSKLLYKITELTYTGVIVANLIPGKEFNKIALALGFLIGLVAFLIAFRLDKKED